MGAPVTQPTAEARTGDGNHQAEGRAGASKAAPDALAPNNPDFKADQPEAAQAVRGSRRRCRPRCGTSKARRSCSPTSSRSGSRASIPADYDPAGLEAAIATGNPAIISPIATERFDQVSSDLALGHVKKPARIDWWVADH